MPLPVESLLNSYGEGGGEGGSGQVETARSGRSCVPEVVAPVSMAHPVSLQSSITEMISNGKGMLQQDEEGQARKKTPSGMTRGGVFLRTCP